MKQLNKMGDFQTLILVHLIFKMVGVLFDGIRK